MRDFHVYADFRWESDKDGCYNLYLWWGKFKVCHVALITQRLDVAVYDHDGEIIDETNCSDKESAFSWVENFIQVCSGVTIDRHSFSQVELDEALAEAEAEMALIDAERERQNQPPTQYKGGLYDKWMDFEGASRRLFETYKLRSVHPPSIVQDEIIHNTEPGGCLVQTPETHYRWFPLIDLVNHTSRNPDILNNLIRQQDLNNDPTP